MPNNKRYSQLHGIDSALRRNDEDEAQASGNYTHEILKTMLGAMESTRT